MEKEINDSSMWILREEIFLTEGYYFYPKPSRVINSNNPLFKEITEAYKLNDSSITIEGISYTVLHNNRKKNLELKSDSVKLVYHKFSFGDFDIKDSVLVLEDKRWRVMNSTKEMFFTSQKTYDMPDNELSNRKIVELINSDGRIYGVWYTEEYDGIKFLIIKNTNHLGSTTFPIITYDSSFMQISHWNKELQEETILELNLVSKN